MEEINFADIKLEEKGDLVVLRVNIPGFKEKDIEIVLSDDRIDISAEKKNEKTSKGKGFFSRHWISNSFGGSIALPSKVIPELIHHEYDGKTLKIELKKK